MCNFCSNFAAAKGVKRKQAKNMDAALRQETFTISIPKVDRRRFKGIVKAMGWNIAPVNRKEKFDVTKTAGFKEAMEDVKHGRVTRYDSVDDLFKELGIEV